MAESRKLAAILVADVVGFSRMTGADEDRTLARLRALRSDLIDPTIAVHSGRVVKRTGDGALVEFRSVVDAVRCAIEIQNSMVERNAGLPADRKIEFRIGIHLGDVVEESDGDLMGDGVNIAARLEGLADAGGLIVSHTVYEHVHGRVPFQFEDLGERSLKNIVRPIRVYRVGWRPDSSTPLQPELPNRASIAVLPFTNMSSDPEQEYFADGLAEDLITDLSKIPGLLVIARNSSFTYKGKAADIRSIAKELGVRYVIEGSVRRAAARVRVNAQLIDATDHSHIWAERFDRDLADVFLMQDDVVSKIVSALAGAIPAVRALPKRRTTNIEAYDLFVRGRSLATLFTLPGIKGARPLLQRAIELDGGLAEAYAWLAMTFHFGYFYHGEPAEENAPIAKAMAAKAVSLEPENADAHIILGYLRAYDGHLSEGVAQFERGLRLNPNHAHGWAMLSDLRVFEGKHEEAIACVHNGIRLDPRPGGDWYWLLGFAEYAAGHYEAAVAALRHPEAIGAGRRRILAASLAQLGQLDDARQEAGQFLAEFPAFSSGKWASAQPFQFEEDRQHFVDGYVKAGLPE